MMDRSPFRRQTRSHLSFECSNDTNVGCRCIGSVAELWAPPLSSLHSAEADFTIPTSDAATARLTFWSASRQRSVNPARSSILRGGWAFATTVPISSEGECVGRDTPPVDCISNTDDALKPRLSYTRHPVDSISLTTVRDRESRILIFNR
jgi:hypothetical protein